MADSVWLPTSAADAPATRMPARHTAIVRVTHWITALCFLALLVSGVEILISHPRFYWGEAGSVMSPALFKLPIPASRSSFPTNFGYVLPDQNGWSRYLHFQAAWAVVLTGVAYLVFGFLWGHFRRNLLPSSGTHKYNLPQRLTYLSVIFILFPLVIWTGLAMSPAIAAAFPLTVTALGGQQSARTIHFFVSVALVLFVMIHISMVVRTGFRRQMRAMITGQDTSLKERL